MRAPVRVLDVGGWTDTWFARRGAVCSLAMEYGTEVLAELSEPRRSAAQSVVWLCLPAFGDRYRIALHGALPWRHPLLETAIRRWAAPGDAGMEITVGSSVPPGSGLGTSASVVVALIAALQVLHGGDISDPAGIARSAHEVETVDLARQSGVQDQIAAACGGANLIEVDEYPSARIRSLVLEPATWEALDRRIVTVFLGTSHDSSAVHEAVISRLAGDDPEALLAPLRISALRAADALAKGDLDAYGDALVSNTEAQAALHPALVDARARQVIEVVSGHGAGGWKVNGAGGPGGTVTFLAPEDRGPVVKALRSLGGLTLLSLRPARVGVHVVDHS